VCAGVRLKVFKAIPCLISPLSPPLLHWITNVPATAQKGSINMLARIKGAEETQSPSRHSRKCSICRRADRKDIEDAYLRWRDPGSIVNEFRLAHHSTIYRHAHATGLSTLRKANLYTALEYIIEKAESITPTATEVINAIRICAQMDGLWTEPPRTHIVIHKNENESAAAHPAPPVSGLPPSNSNREPEIRT
jgi:hypothetical protein